jgi:transposase
MDFGTLLAYSMSRRWTEMWKSERETAVALGLGALLFVAYCIAGAGDLSEEQRQAEETWQRPVVSETGVVEAWD